MIINKINNSIRINKTTLTQSEKQEIADFICDIISPKQNDEIYDKYTRVYQISHVEDMLINTPQDIFTITVTKNDLDQIIIRKKS